MVMSMGNLKIGRLVLGVCGTNCYFVYREGSKDVLFFDPADRGRHIYESLTDNGFQVKGILLTHGHFDHILGLEELKELSGAPVYASEKEEALCYDARLNLSAHQGPPCSVKADNWLKDKEEVTIAGMTFQMLSTSGHTEGSCCYYFEEDGILISGDTLFCDSIGRTDFPTGDMKKLLQSVREQLFCLPDATVVYPGHGASTEIGYEKRNNQFFM